MQIPITVLIYWNILQPQAEHAPISHNTYHKLLWQWRLSNKWPFQGTNTEALPLFVCVSGSSYHPATMPSHGSFSWHALSVRMPHQPYTVVQDANSEVGNLHNTC